ncbi:MAG: Holliday junction resolvase RuvX [Candidatus Algichlamydia australiensis]|nr:Holliday junction resolvase RuvX [Chlamydiales bacterium]
MRYIGIDYGRARIGIAKSDPMGILASPLPTIKAEKEHKDSIQKILSSLEDPFEAFVVGLPLHLSGNESEMSKEVRLFAKLLEEVSGKRVHLIDERLTSTLVEKEMGRAGINRKKRAQNVDALSAVVILQSWLEANFSAPHSFDPIDQ